MRNPGEYTPVNQNANPESLLKPCYYLGFILLNEINITESFKGALLKLLRLTACQLTVARSN